MTDFYTLPSGFSKEAALRLTTMNNATNKNIALIVAIMLVYPSRVSKSKKESRGSLFQVYWSDILDSNQ